MQIVITNKYQVKLVSGSFGGFSTQKNNNKNKEFLV